MRDVDLFGQALGLTEPWRVERSEFDAVGHRLDLYLDFMTGSRFGCPNCGAPGCPVHDTTRKTWRHLNFFEHEAYLHARVPRVRCDRCGVRQVAVPWARPESGFTLLFEAFVMALVAEMPVKAVAELVGEHDTRIWRVLHHYVAVGRAAADFSATRRVGLDETSRRRGHHYISLFVDLDRPRLLFATPGRGADTLGRFKADLVAHDGRSETIEELVMDMAPPFIAGAALHFPDAAVTFDRFHVMWNLGFAIDEVRRAEQRDGGRGLKRSRYLWLRRSDALSERQQAEIERLAAAYPRTGRAYRLKLAFEDFWHQPPDAAEAYLEAWCRWAERSRQEPIIEFAKLVRSHWRGILRWATSRISNGILEATASLIQAAKRRARGYRTTENLIAMAYLVAGKLDFAVTHAE